MHLMGWLLHSEGLFRKGLGSKQKKMMLSFLDKEKKICCLGSFHQSDFSVDLLAVAQRRRS